MTDIEIAHSYKLENIKNIASKLGLKDSEYAVMYASMAKVNLDYKDKVDSNLILVTSINPTSAGNGKTTVSIGLADAMSSMGKKCLFGAKRAIDGTCIWYERWSYWWGL